MGARWGGTQLRGAKQISEGGGGVVGSLAQLNTATPQELQRGEGFLCQVKLAAVNFAVGSVAEAPGFCAVNFADTPRTVVVCGAWQARWSLAAGANSAEDPGFCVGNFAADLHRKISHTKLTGPQSPPPPPTLYWIALPQGHFKREWEGKMLQMGV